MEDPTKTVLFHSAEGPEGLTIYTSAEEGVVDWASDIPALYIEVSLSGVYTKLGPFSLSRIRTDLERFFLEARTR